MLWVISFCESSHLCAAHHASYFWICVVHAFLGIFFSPFPFGRYVKKKKNLGRTVALRGAGLPAGRPSQLRDAVQVFTIKHLPNTDNILPGCFYHVFVAAATPSPTALNKYISLCRCQHSSFKSDECISALGFIITSVKMAAVLTITYENRYARQAGCLLAPCYFLSVFFFQTS